MIFAAVWNPNLNLLQFVCLSISRGFSFNIFSLKWVINILPTKISQLIQQQHNIDRNKNSIQLVFIPREIEHKFSWTIYWLKQTAQRLMSGTKWELSESTKYQTRCCMKKAPTKNQNLKHKFQVY